MSTEADRIAELVRLQNEVLEPLMAEVDAVLAKDSRQPAPPKDERDLWGKPG